VDADEIKEVERDMAPLEEQNSSQRLERYLTLAMLEMETKHSGQFANLKIETDNFRIWLIRPAGGITVDRLIGGVWKTVLQTCT
jgi:hypothetical protein